MNALRLGQRWWSRIVGWCRIGHSCFLLLLQKSDLLQIACTLLRRGGGPLHRFVNNCLHQGVRGGGMESGPGGP